MANSKTILYCKENLKQLYTCTMESTKFINPQALSSSLATRVHYSIGPFMFIKFIGSVVHAYNYYLV